MTWERTFHRHTTDTGEALYVDTATGETYPSIPDLNPSDGKPT